ncbi:MAG: hypothetical protein ACOYOK_09430, partial [Pseudobdellovibrionaceae bacterium]
MFELSLQSLIQDQPKLNWLKSDDIRPYIFVRPDNSISNPGQKHKLDWFQQQNTIVKNPLDVKEIAFADR